MVIMRLEQTDSVWVKTEGIVEWPGVFGGHEAVPFRIIFYNSYIHKKNRIQTAEAVGAHVETETSTPGQIHTLALPVLLLYIDTKR